MLRSFERNKDAANTYPLHDFIAARWSPGAFSERPAPPEKVRSLLEAARWAASSMNQQPWRFLVGTREDGPAYEKLLATLKESNRAWAERAPELMVAVAPNARRERAPRERLGQDELVFGAQWGDSW